MAWRRSLVSRRESEPTDGHISNVTDVTSNDTVLNAMSWMYDWDSSGDDSTSINMVSSFRSAWQIVK